MTRQRAEERLAEVEADLEYAYEVGLKEWFQTLYGHRRWLREKIQQMPAIAGRVGEDGPTRAA